MVEAVELFTIFGGVDWGKIDTQKEPLELIKSLILQDYLFIRNDISDLTTGAPVYHAILSGVALGDGRTHSAFKRAKVDTEVGNKAVVELCERGILKVEKSKKIFTSWADNYAVSDKLYFTSPFLRFWFAFISPLFKGIRDGDYKEMQQRFENTRAEFVQLTFLQLSQELLKDSFKDDPIVECGSYWDKDVEIDIFAKTKSGKTIVGSCRYTNSKVKKSELNKLKESASEAKIKADIFVLVAKNGFSNELKTLKGENLKLFTLKNFKRLVE